MTDHERKPSVIHFFIDKRPYETTSPKHSVRQLLADFAKEDPSQTTLVEVRGHDLIKHENPDEIIDIHDGEHFVVYHNSPTPVS